VAAALKRKLAAEKKQQDAAAENPAPSGDAPTE
jgi:hypothetical protein